MLIRLEVVRISADALARRILASQPTKLGLWEVESVDSEVIVESPVTEFEVAGLH